ncbi:hypothetical protein [Streptomyces litchfieldiae]|uniref:Integral membrane protein n=1 Tax=Streptomyces litchfieldiae TaxID=3075543 RepID=A0ABU2N113_9ACTN|nr:hypothetical protein [Streptomyces sp. DSM 44938]MDT0346449.1 hypothetical protein [Streptomyces sp. DSM 44938]
MNWNLSALASDKAGGFDTIAVLFILLIGLVVVFSLIAYLCSSIARRKQRSRDGRSWLRAGAVLSICAAICVYLWGTLHVAFMEDEHMREACVEAGGQAKADEVDGYGASYLPLRFECRIDEGDSYSAAIPPWINPALGVFASLALITGVASGATRDDVRPSEEPSIRKGKS